MKYQNKSNTGTTRTKRLLKPTEIFVSGKVLGETRIGQVRSRNIRRHCSVQEMEVCVDEWHETNLYGLQETTVLKREVTRHFTLLECRQVQVGSVADSAAVLCSKLYKAEWFTCTFCLCTAFRKNFGC